MFRFTPLADPARLNGTSRLSITALDEKAVNPDFFARFRGSLLALFGAPLRSSSYSDNAFTYLLEVTDDHGHVWILTAYQGPSGPAFGGLIHDLGAETQSSEALLALIEQTPPADFEVVLSAPEYESRITYGCRAGACYWREDPA
jgi:hypothetical protein